MIILVIAALGTIGDVTANAIIDSKAQTEQERHNCELEKAARQNGKQASAIQDYIDSKDDIPVDISVPKLIQALKKEEEKTKRVIQISVLAHLVPFIYNAINKESRTISKTNIKE